MPAIGSLENWPERIRDRADQPAVDVDGAAAHPGDDAGLGERATFEPGQDQIAPRADDVAQHAEDVNLEFLQPITLEDSATDADHAGLELVDREVTWSLPRGHGRRQRRKSASEGSNVRVFIGCTQH